MAVIIMTFEQWEYEEMIKDKEKEVLNRVREAIEKARNSNEMLKLGTLTFLEKELGFEEKEK